VTSTRPHKPLSLFASPGNLAKWPLGFHSLVSTSNSDPFLVHAVFQFGLTGDYWLQANLYLGLQDFDFEDQRPYYFSVLAGQGKSHVFNVDLGCELAMWEKSFQRATFMEVQRTGVSMQATHLHHNCAQSPEAWPLGTHDLLFQKTSQERQAFPRVPLSKRRFPLCRACVHQGGCNGREVTKGFFLRLHLCYI
jgi:hypothetical protein